jgi:Ca-activated chloride channel homolog
MKRPLPWLAITGAFCVVALAGAAWSLGWSRLWLTQDQRGRHLMAQQRYAEAAAEFADPMWVGVAHFRAANFKEAAQTFGGMDTAEAAYDQGNALVMQGKYDEAIARYDRALALRPGWPDAEANRTLARLRAEMVRQKGGDAGDQREGADQIVYDKDKKNQAGQETQVSGAPMSDEAVRALWLKRVQTRPADFLKARFAYQLQAGSP